MEKGRFIASFFQSRAHQHPKSALVGFFFNPENQAKQTGYVFWAFDDDNFHGKDSFSPTMHKLQSAARSAGADACFLLLTAPEGPEPPPQERHGQHDADKAEGKHGAQKQDNPDDYGDTGQLPACKKRPFHCRYYPFPQLFFEGSNDIPLYVWRFDLVPAVLGKRTGRRKESHSFAKIKSRVPSSTWIRAFSPFCWLLAPKGKSGVSVARFKGY